MPDVLGRAEDKREQFRKTRRLFVRQIPATAPKLLTGSGLWNQLCSAVSHLQTALLGHLRYRRCVHSQPRQKRSPFVHVQCLVRARPVLEKVPKFLILANAVLEMVIWMMVSMADNQMFEIHQYFVRVFIFTIIKIGPVVMVQGCVGIGFGQCQPYTQRRMLGTEPV